MHVIVLLQAFLKDFVLTYWLDILIVALFAVALVIAWRNGKKDLVRKILYGLVVRAEKMVGSKTGQEKLSMVLADIYPSIPWYIRMFFTKAEILKFIEDSVAQLKKRLASCDVNLLGYEEEVAADLLKCTDKPPDAEITP